MRDDETRITLDEAEVESFCEHVEFHRLESAPDCRFCAKRADRELAPTAPESGTPMCPICDVALPHPLPDTPTCGTWTCRSALDARAKLRRPASTAGTMPHFTEMVRRVANSRTAFRESPAVAALLSEVAALTERAYRAGFIAGAGGTPKGHASDFGDDGWDALVARANEYAARYVATHPNSSEQSA